MQLALHLEYRVGLEIGGEAHNFHCPQMIVAEAVFQSSPRSLLDGINWRTESRDHSKVSVFQVPIPLSILLLSPH